MPYICLLPFSVPQGAVAGCGLHERSPMSTRGYARRHSARATHSTLPVPPANPASLVSWKRALADLLLVDGNPLENIKLIEDPDKNFLLIMKDGAIYKNILPK